MRLASLLLLLAACGGAPSVDVSTARHAVAVSGEHPVLVLGPAGAALDGAPVPREGLADAVRAAAPGPWLLLAVAPETPWGEVSPVLDAAADRFERAGFVVADPSPGELAAAAGPTTARVLPLGQAYAFRAAPASPLSTGADVRLLGGLDGLGGGVLLAGRERRVGEVLDLLDLAVGAGAPCWWTGVADEDAGQGDGGARASVRLDGPVAVLPVALAWEAGACRRSLTAASIVDQPLPATDALVADVTGALSAERVAEGAAPVREALDRCVGRDQAAVRVDIGADGAVVGLTVGATGASREATESCVARTLHGARFPAATGPSRAVLAIGPAEAG